MNNQIINFTFEAQTVRTATNPQGEIYFCLPDVSAILAIKNGRDTIAKLDEKGVEKIYTPTKGGTQEITFINEPNLYRVIFRSNKAEAVKFQNWVFDEVLPSIRKTGQYRHTISIEQQHAIRSAIASICKDDSTHYQTLYKALHDEFCIPRYTELLAVDFEKAMRFIASFTHCHELSNTQKQALKDLVNLVADSFKFKGSVTNAVWARLRTITNKPSPTPFTTHDLPVLASELYRLIAISEQYRDKVYEMEKRIIKIAFRYGGDAIPLLAEFDRCTQNFNEQKLKQLSIFSRPLQTLIQ